MPIELKNTILEERKITADSAEIIKIEIDLGRKEIKLIVKYTDNDVMVSIKTFIVKDEEFLQMATAKPSGNSLYEAIKVACYGYLISKSLIIGQPK